MADEECFHERVPESASFQCFLCQKIGRKSEEFGEFGANQSNLFAVHWGDPEYFVVSANCSVHVGWNFRQSVRTGWIGRQSVRIGRIGRQSVRLGEF